MKHATFTQMSLGLMSLLLSCVGAQASNFSWTYGDDPESFIIYRAHESLTCEESWVVPGNMRTYQILDEPFYDDIVFMSITAKSGNDESGHSNEIMLKWSGGERCPCEFTVTPQGAGSVVLDFDTHESLSGYQLRYQGSGGAQIIADIDGPTTLYNVPEGTVSFTLYAKDADGRVIVNNNCYESVTAEVGGVQPPPNQPVIGVESIGYATTQKVVIGFEMNDQNVHYYKVNGYSSSLARNASITSKAPGDVFSDLVVYYGDAFCGQTSLPIVFLRVTAVDYAGQESMSTVSYRLMGDIVGTAYEGVPSQNAIVDATDKTLFIGEYKKYSINPYARRSTDFCEEYDLYELLPFRTAEVADYNQDGYVNSWDYNYFRTSVLGKSGVGK